VKRLSDLASAISPRSRRRLQAQIIGDLEALGSANQDLARELRETRAELQASTHEVEALRTELDARIAALDERFGVLTEQTRLAIEDLIERVTGG
jgi:hypothetical protein